MRYVIIGNGPAAVAAIEAIRKTDKEGAVTLLSAEKEHTYSRPLISYLLLGRTDEQRMRYRPDGFYTDYQVDFKCGVSAEKIDSAAKTVTASDGMAYPYDKLLVATGSRPFVPPVAGLEAVPYHTFMTLADARGLLAALTPESRVLIVGAGLIGLKCAEGINHLVKQITVVDMAGQILPSILDAEGAALVKKHVEAQGIRFILGDSAAAFAPGRAVLKSGGEVPFDVLVMAVGVRPNVELAQQAGCAADRGLEVDEHCQTTVPDIYAAGDCAKSLDITTGQHRILALLPNASMQGEIAGAAMCGGTAPAYPAIPMNAMGLFGLHMITAGVMRGERHTVAVPNGYKCLCTEEDRLTGYILIGDVQRAGIYTSLIREQTSLKTVDFDLMLDKPQLMAFSKRVRMMKMGGERV